MATYQTEMSVHLAALSTQQVLSLISLILDQMGFDDETRYELVLEGPGNQRQETEIGRQQIPPQLQGSIWPELHQLILTNTWVRGLNFKLHVVRRNGVVTVGFKCEIAEARQRERLITLLKTRLEEWRVADAGKAELLEHERLFGSLVLHARIAAQSKPAFLTGDLRAALRSGWEVVQSGLGRCTELRRPDPVRWEAFFLQQPPRVLFPDLSGKRLQEELTGLGKLAAGLYALVMPYLENRSGAPALDPALTLKLLVVMSLLLERLETSAPNPVVRQAKPRRRPAPAKPRVRAGAAKRRPTKRLPAKPARSRRK